MLSAVIPSEHSYSAMPLAWQPKHQRFVHSGPLVLGADPLKFPTPTVDRDRTVSRRSKPSSRTTFHSEPPDHYDLLSYLLDLWVSQLSALLPLYSLNDFRPFWAHLRTPPLLFRRRPPQSNYPPYIVLGFVDPKLEPQHNQGGISRLAPQILAYLLQSLPPILHKLGQSSM